MNESIKKMYEQEPKTWYAKIIVALIVAALLAWSLSTVQSTGSNGSGLSVAGKIISGIFHPDTGLLFDLFTSGVAYLLLETMCIAFLGTIVGAVLSIPLFPCGSKPDAKAGCADLPCVYHGDPYDPGICIRTYVYPCDGTGTIRRTAHHVTLFDRYDQ